jgi:hypothetical protein
MADGRTKPRKPNRAWHLLDLLAINDGELSWLDTGASPQARAHMKRLRAHLREIFGLEDDPIEDYKKNKCWRTKFTIVDMRQNSPRFRENSRRGH